MKENKKDVVLNSRGTNAKIKAHILSDKEMRKYHFNDFRDGYWYYWKKIMGSISMNITIPKDGSDIEIITLDDDFMQPYDYQAMLRDDPNFKYALQVKKQVEKIMKEMEENGILSGHEYGEYI